MNENEYEPVKTTEGRKVAEGFFYLLPHILIVTSLMFVVLFVTDRFNSSMNFVAHDLTETLIIICGLLFTAQAVNGFFHIRAYAAPLAQITAVISVAALILSVMLIAACLKDFSTDEARLMLEKGWKLVLFISSLITLLHSMLLINLQRRYKRRINSRKKL